MSAFLSTAAASPSLGAHVPSLTEAWRYIMLIVIGVALAVAVFVLTFLTSAGRRSGPLDLGSVSTQWLAEHRDYEGLGRSR